MMAAKRIRRGTWLGAAAIGAAFALASPAMAKDCGAMTGLALDKGKVTAATLVAPGTFQPPAGFGPPPGIANSSYKALPAFCRVQATLTPTSDSDIKVEVWLPAAGWNGKLVGIGNGIWAGNISYAEMALTLAAGYAVVATDTGHTGTGLTAEWAVGHPEKVVDFGSRAIHLMTVTAKAAIKDFYGQAAKYSLWNSCSTGGRQGLMAAARYPEDFDAVSSKAPANPMTDLMTQSMWAGYQAHRTPGSGMTPSLLAFVHKAAVAQCDSVDGTTDGLIARPGACRFDPAMLGCQPGQTSTCLTPDQVATMKALYAGVLDPKTGRQILPGWPVGSEMQMAVLMMGKEPFPVATDYFRLLVHGNQPGWDWMAMDYPAEMQAARAYGAKMLNVTAQDLQPFFARGGKLLLSHGWTDGLIPASNTIKFYGELQQVTPKAAQESQLRLFMVPGMDHCGGGEGASNYDTLGTIDAWVSGGPAPDRIIATRGGAATGPAMPGAPVLPPLSRPLCPFPAIASYKGSGSKDDAASFSCTIVS
ncbi:tannase/feruloyl esterase family alpha/beta hydrolase [Sphingomonas sp. MMS24-J13]|uniref:tannase/feruloyl esterase family alpha/beta hydrolase n=1 Tax=Sphingomonas sp. MMS24-J13 TaxID=3238686 RepID=UPI00384C5BC5